MATDSVIDRLERELAGSIGAASARAMVSRITGQQSVGMTELIDIADEAQRLTETTNQLSERTRQLEKTARQLREANERFRTLDAQEDDLLSQVSHELRTPMTSIRSLSEILRYEEELSAEEQDRFVTIIHDESVRSTRLLDEIFDLSRLEAGAVSLTLAEVHSNDPVTAALTPFPV